MNNKFTKEELEKILNLHEKWLNRDEDGVRANLIGAKLSRANLIGADLREADLSRAYLSGAYLSRANLIGANLSRANLIGADLREADLSRAYLREADLSRANLIGADLSGAYLSGANLSEAKLSRANLSGANLSEAKLSRANLSGAKLIGANLFGADLSRANLSGAKLIGANLFGADLSRARINYPICCPEKGSFIGFKKASGYIVELEILSDSLRSSATSRKCRCDKARVLSITKLDGTDDGTLTVSSNKDKNFIYKIGEIIEVKDFDTNRWNECSTGIHFFITRQEAVDYYG